MLELGTRNDRQGPEFGHVQRALLFPADHATILDSRLNTLHTFALTGRLVASVARPGSGPGEFRVPKAVVTAGKTVIAVLDAGKAEIISFSWRENRWHYENARRVPTHIEDVCLLDHRLFGVGNSFRDSTIAHVLKWSDSSDDEERSFGSPLATGTPLRRAVLSKGLRVACGTNRIIVAGRWSPEIRGYAPAGNLLWVHHLRPFEPVELEERGRGVIFRPGPNGRVHVVAELGVWGTSLVYVQVGLMTRDVNGQDQFAEVTTHWLRLSDGVLVAQQKNLPIIGDITSDHLLFRDNHDLPGFSLYRINRPRF